MANYGTGMSRKSKEEIFQICLTKALSTVCASPSHYNALEFYEAVNLAKQNYAIQLRTLEQEKAVSNAQFVTLGI